jgi:hypothetical protein
MYRHFISGFRYVAVLLFSTPLLFICHNINAQKVTVEADGFVGRTPQVKVVVREGHSRLEGAAVELYTPSDTLRGITEEFGVISFPNRYRRDSVLLKVSYLGYKPVSYKTRIMLSSPVFDVEMEADTTQLNAIIIKDDAIAMVVHGDTTIFNAAAFNMRDKDPLGNLLEKIPGIKIENGTVTANGQKVSKILINGKSLFGRDINAAMNMIYSEDVRKVRIYDEHDQDRLIEADTLKVKERVVDVVTNRPIDKVVGGNANLNAGAFTDKGSNNKVDWLAGGNAMYNRFGTDIPNINLTAEAAKNVQWVTPMSSPEIKVGCDFSINRTKKRKSSSNQRVYFNYSDKFSETVSSDRYTPSDSYRTRISDYTERNSGKTLNTSYTGNWSHSVAEKNIFSYSFSAGYDGMWSDYAQKTESAIDDKISMTDARTLDRKNSGSVSGGISWNRLMAKSGRGFNVSCKYSGKYGGGGGTRKTDSPDVLLMQSLVDSSSIRNHGINVEASYKEPLTEKLSLTASYNLEWLHSFSRRIAWDEILNARNMVNTHEYTQNETGNTVGAKLEYNLFEQGLYMLLEIKYKNIYQFRREVLPTDMHSPDSYNYIGPGFSILYMPGTWNFRIAYYETAAPPSIEQKRNTVNDSNPLFLIGGNPDLKLPVIRNANLSTNFSTASISTTWGIEATYTECTDNIVNKVTFFPEVTTLEQYGGYKASAGSQLSQPVNVNGNRSFSFSAEAGIYSKPLKSTVTPSIAYSFARNPFFQTDERFDNIGHDLCFGLAYRSSFSKYFSLKVSDKTAIGRSLRNGEKVYDYINENISATAEVNFLKRMVTMVGVVYNKFRTDTGFGNNEKVYLDASVGVHLDKQEKSSIWLKGCDLLGMDNNNEVSISELYVRSRYSTILGRSIFVSYQYRF